MRTFYKYDEITLIVGRILMGYGVVPIYYVIHSYA